VCCVLCCVLCCAVLRVLCCAVLCLLAPKLTPIHHQHHTTHHPQETLKELPPLLASGFWPTLQAVRAGRVALVDGNQVCVATADKQQAVALVCLLTLVCCGVCAVNVSAVPDV
jgi:hypothetical protein